MKLSFGQKHIYVHDKKFKGHKGGRRERIEEKNNECKRGHYIMLRAILITMSPVGDDMNPHMTQNHYDVITSFKHAMSDANLSTKSCKIFCSNSCMLPDTTNNVFCYCSILWFTK